MPKDFTNCVRNGGKVKTKKLKNGKYIKICYDKDGNSFSGEVHTQKKSSDKARAEKKKYDESRKLAESLLELKKHFDTNYHN